MARSRLCLVLLVVAAATASARVPAAETGVTSVARGVNLLPGRFVPGEQPDGNSVIFDGKDGLVVFDTGRHAQHTQRIVEYARSRNLQISAIINSHWHLDHVGGNAMLRRLFPGIRVYASDALRGAQKEFLADYRKTLEKLMDTVADPAGRQSLKDELALIDAGPALLPDEVIGQSGPRSIAQRTLRIGLARNAVTAGDVWLFDQATRTLASGDLVTLPAPLLDTACPRRWAQALDEIARTDFVILIPGHGAPMRRAQFDRYRRAFADLLGCAASARSKSACEDGWVHDTADLVPEQDQSFARQLLDYYIDHILRADSVRASQYC